MFEFEFTKVVILFIEFKKSLQRQNIYDNIKSFSKSLNKKRMNVCIETNLTKR